MNNKIRQLTLPIIWGLSYSPEEYVVSECNRYAFDWLEKWPFRIRENFACIVGDSGSGKSHLAGIWAKRVGAKTFNARSGIFEQWFDMSSDVTNKYFVIDDADTIEDDVLLFYIYNTIKEHDAYLLLTAKNPPIRWNINLADVRSRLLTINVVHIQKPDETAIIGIIKQMLKQRGIEVQDNIVFYIANNVERSYASINYWINEIDLRLPSNKKLTMNIVKPIIEDFGN